MQHLPIFKKRWGPVPNEKMSLGIYFNILLIISVLLSFCTAVYGAQATHPYGDDDLIALGSSPAFQGGVQVTARKRYAAARVLCSATRVQLMGSTAPAFITAAHCIEGASEIWVDVHRADRYILHPYYEWNRLADIAVFTLPVPLDNPIAYPLVVRDYKTVAASTLVSVGYGANPQGMCCLAP